MKYAEYDLKLVDLIKNGCNDFNSLCNRMADENKEIQPGLDSFRVTDRRLQALRKKGVIEYWQARKRWIIKDRSAK